MIYPIPPETEFFCWFFFNGCCNSTIVGTIWNSPCGVPPFIYFIFGFIILFVIWYNLEKKEAGK
jgi:hypothetical protein